MTDQRIQHSSLEYWIWQGYDSRDDKTVKDVRKILPIDCTEKNIELTRNVWKLKFVFERFAEHR